MLNKNCFFLLLAIGGLLTACQDFDDFESTEGANYDAEYALPLVSTHLSIQDALENAGQLSTLYIDEEGVIHFEYRGDVIAQNSDTLFGRINEALSGQPVPLFDNRIALPLKVGDGAEFDRLVIREGKLTWFFQNNHPEPVQVTLSMPDVYKDGEPLQLTGTAPGYSGSGQLPLYTNIFLPADLAGYVVAPPPGVDSIYVEYELIRQGLGADTLAVGALTLSDLFFSYMEGYFGTEEQAGGRDTIIIDFFDNWVMGDIYFADPKVTFRIENSFGIPTRSRVNLFNVLTVRGETLALEGELIDNGIDFSYPTLDQIGDVIVENYVFDKNNSNIDVILGAGPVAIDYDVDAITHPDGDTSQRGFLTDSSYYRVQVEVDLPIFGRSVDFLARDTFELALGELGESVYKAEFKLVAQNELPLNVGLQGYFLDEQGNVLDSLFQDRQRIIKSASANAEGIATEIEETVTFIDFPEERFDRIRPMQSLIIVAAFTTANEGQQSVRLLAEQGVAIKLGAIFGRRGE